MKESFLNASLVMVDNFGIEVKYVVAETGTSHNIKILFFSPDKIFTLENVPVHTHTAAAKIMVNQTLDIEDDVIILVPAVGDSIEYGSQVFLVQEQPLKDSQGVFWELNLSLKNVKI